MSLLLLFGGAGIPPVYLTPPPICYPTTAYAWRGDVDRGQTNTILIWMNTSASADRFDGGVSAMNDRFDGGTSAAADRADGGTSANVKTCMLGGGS